MLRTGQGASGIAARRPRGLCRRRAGRRRHHAIRRSARAAQTVAAIYDMKADPANRDTMTYEEDGGRHSIYFLRPKTRDDLQRRMDGHRKIADFTYGMFGRSPDHVASFVTGMAMKPDALPAPARLRRQPRELLSPHPRQRHLRGLRRGAAAGRAQSGILPQAEHPGADAARRARGRRRRRHLRHEDAGDRRALRQRDLDRQRHPARARPEEGGDHLRDRRATRRG